VGSPTVRDKCPNYYGKSTRLLAINIAHYESAYGALPLDDTLEMAYSDEPNQAQIDLMTRGMGTMVGVLGGIV